MEIVKAIILGVIEGVTEFLPISSTGHLILANEWIAFREAFTKIFDVAIQSGAILAVIVVYWKVIWPFRKHGLDRAVLATWSKILLAVAPAIVLGALFGTKIQDALFSPILVALALVVGGIALMFLEWRRHTEHITSMKAMSYRVALMIGVIQCFAFIPGTSRSAATIIGALFLGVSRSLAAEFSFLLAIPTLLAATAYSLVTSRIVFTANELMLLAVGFIAAFGSAFVVVKSFLRYIQSKNFLPFAYYRIALGLFMIIYFAVR